MTFYHQFIVQFIYQTKRTIHSQKKYHTFYSLINLARFLTHLIISIQLILFLTQRNFVRIFEYGGIALIILRFLKFSTVLAIQVRLANFKCKLQIGSRQTRYLIVGILRNIKIGWLNFPMIRQKKFRPLWSSTPDRQPSVQLQPQRL